MEMINLSRTELFPSMTADSSDSKWYTFVSSLQNTNTQSIRINQ